MITPFDTAMNFTLPAEGGYVDDPVDPGGATNHGITQSTYDRYRASINELNQSVRLIASAEVRDIYREMYWVPAHCDEMPEKLGVCHFDCAVNMGISAAIKIIQSCANVAVDGIWGPTTQTAVIFAGDDLIQPYLDARIQRYRDIVTINPKEAVFLNGWLNRVKSLQAYLRNI